MKKERITCRGPEQQEKGRHPVLWLQKPTRRTRECFKDFSHPQAKPVRVKKEGGKKEEELAKNRRRRHSRQGQSKETWKKVLSLKDRTHKG